MLEWLKYIRPAEEQPSTHDEIALRDIVLIGIILRAVEETYIQDAIGDLNLDLRISGSVSEALVEPTDVLIDFTKADVVKANVMAAITKGVHVVIGSSGLSDEDFVEINQAALDNNVGAIAAGNFAITAVLLQRFACEAAKYLSHWEIIDYASDAKEDAPSGTARELAFQLSEIDSRCYLRRYTGRINSGFRFNLSMRKLSPSKNV